MDERFNWNSECASGAEQSGPKSANKREEIKLKLIPKLHGIKNGETMRELLPGYNRFNIINLCIEGDAFAMLSIVRIKELVVSRRPAIVIEVPIKIVIDGAKRRAIRPTNPARKWPIPRFRRERGSLCASDGKAITALFPPPRHKAPSPRSEVTSECRALPSRIRRPNVRLGGEAEK